MRNTGSCGINQFSLSSQIGGADAAIATRRHEQRLRDAINHWTGSYSSRVREFAFLLRVDGDIHTYTEEWNIHGAQPAKRKRDWIEVEIGIPKSAWEEDTEGHRYKHFLVGEIDKGLSSMINRLRADGGDVNEKALLTDWKKIRDSYVSASTSRRRPQ